MYDPITGMHVENVTCKKCRNRHPEAWTCKYAKTAAEICRAMRAEPNPLDTRPQDELEAKMQEIIDLVKNSAHSPTSFFVTWDFLRQQLVNDGWTPPSNIPHDETPSHKLNGDRTVAVSTDVFIDPDMTKCPRGVKVQLEGAGGCLLYGTYDGKDPFYVGWAPLPRRRPKC